RRATRWGKVSDRRLERPGDDLVVDDQAVAVAVRHHLLAREGVELEGLDDAAVDRLESAGADAGALGGLFGDLLHRRIGDLEVDAVLAEEVPGRLQDSLGGLLEDAGEDARVQVLEDDGVVEAGEELRLHAVLEEVLLPEVVAEGEVLADPDLAVLVGGGGGELDAALGGGDSFEDLVVKGLERPRAEEEHL